MKDSHKSSLCEAAEAEKDPQGPGARSTSDASTATQTRGSSPSRIVRQSFTCENLFSATVHIGAEHRCLLSARLDVASHALFPRRSCCNSSVGCREPRGRRASAPRSTGGCWAEARAHSATPGPQSNCPDAGGMVEGSRRNVSMKIKWKVTYCILMYWESIFLEDILGDRFWYFSYELLRHITKFYEWKQWDTDIETEAPNHAHSPSPSLE